MLRKSDDSGVTGEVKLAQRVGIVDDAKGAGDVREPIVEAPAARTMPLGLADARARCLPIDYHRPPESSLESRP
jgi:hypothetical protein